MEEIEYLEEYEDIVLPGRLTNKDDEGSSSSLDQDIFNCLFDDNSDDDNDEQQHPKNEESILSSKHVPRTSLDSIDLLNDLGEQVAKEFELKKDITDQTSKKACNLEKKPSSTSRTKTLVTSNSGTTKKKTVTTVKPTIQNKELPRKSNTAKQQPRNIASLVSLTSTKANTKTILPTSSRQALIHYKSISPSSSFTTTKKSLSSKPIFIKQRPATIVKPEKIISKDPPEDPLNLDDFSSSESDNCSISDISGETYNSISEFDDDDYDFTSHIENLDDEDDESCNSQIIDISNDSSGSRSQFEELRATTPSPVVSEDRDIYSSPGFPIQQSSSKLMANHEIIKSLLTKGEKPKLLQLINEHGDAYDIDTKCEEKQTVASKSTETLKESREYSAHQQDTPKSVRATTMDPSYKSRDTQSPGTVSHDSYLSVVNEMLEESYAEAMKSNKNYGMPNQEVGAEMEIGVEETTHEDFCHKEEFTIGKEDKSSLSESTIKTNEEMTSKEDINNVNKIERVLEPPQNHTTEEANDVLRKENKIETIKRLETTTDLSDKSKNISNSNVLQRRLKQDNTTEDKLKGDHGFQRFYEGGIDNIKKTENMSGGERKSISSNDNEPTTSKVHPKHLITRSNTIPSKTSDTRKEKSADINRLVEKSFGRCKESLNTNNTDAPRGVIRNPFVQRTNKKVSKDVSNVSSKDRPISLSSETICHSKQSNDNKLSVSKSTTNKKIHNSEIRNEDKYNESVSIHGNEKIDAEKSKNNEHVSMKIHNLPKNKTAAVDKMYIHSKQKRKVVEDDNHSKSPHTEKDSIKKFSSTKEAKTTSSSHTERKEQRKSNTTFFGTPRDTESDKEVEKNVVCVDNPQELVLNATNEQDNESARIRQEATSEKSEMRTTKEVFKKNTSKNTSDFKHRKDMSSGPNSNILEISKESKHKTIRDVDLKDSGSLPTPSQRSTKAIISELKKNSSDIPDKSQSQSKAHISEKPSLKCIKPNIAEMSTDVVDDAKNKTKDTSSHKQMQMQIIDKYKTDKDKNNETVRLNDICQIAGKEESNLKAGSVASKDANEKRNVRPGYGKTITPEESINSKEEKDKNNENVILNSTCQSAAKKGEYNISNLQVESAVSKDTKDKMKITSDYKETITSEESIKSKKEKDNTNVDNNDTITETLEITTTKSVDLIIPQTKNTTDVSESTNISFDDAESTKSRETHEIKTDVSKNANASLDDAELQKCHKNNVIQEIRTENLEIETTRIAAEQTGELNDTNINPSELFARNVIHVENRTPEIDYEKRETSDIQKITEIKRNAEQREENFASPSNLECVIGAETTITGAPNVEDNAENNFSSAITRNIRNVKGDESIILENSPKLLLSRSSPTTTDNQSSSNTKEVEEDGEPKNPQIRGRKTRSAKLDDDQETKEYNKRAIITTPTIENFKFILRSNPENVQDTSLIETKSPQENSSIKNETDICATEGLTRSAIVSRDNDNSQGSSFPTSRESDAISPKKITRKTRGTKSAFDASSEEIKVPYESKCPKNSNNKLEDESLNIAQRNTRKTRNSTPVSDDFMKEIQKDKNVECPQVSHSVIPRLTPSIKKQEPSSTKPVQIQSKKTRPTTDSKIYYFDETKDQTNTQDSTVDLPSTSSHNKSSMKNNISDKDVKTDSELNIYVPGNNNCVESDFYEKNKTAERGVDETEDAALPSVSNESNKTKNNFNSNESELSKIPETKTPHCERNCEAKDNEIALLKSEKICSESQNVGEKSEDPITRVQENIVTKSPQRPASLKEEPRRGSSSLSKKDKVETNITNISPKNSFEMCGTLETKASKESITLGRIDTPNVAEDSNDAGCHISNKEMSVNIDDVKLVPAASENIVAADDAKRVEAETSTDEKPNTAGRKLRKRATESPFPSNTSDKKELFKQPQKSLVPTQGSLTSNLGNNNKRRLRSPALDIGAQSSAAKRPKIDRSRRFRDVPADNFGTVDVWPTERTDTFKQSPASSKQVYNQSPQVSIHKQSPPIDEHEPNTQTVEIVNADEKLNLTEKTLNTDISEDCGNNGVEQSLSDVSKKLNLARRSNEKTCSNKKSVQSDKKRSKPSPDKQKSQAATSSEKSTACTVLSFAEWLKCNSRKEVLEEKPGYIEHQEVKVDSKVRKRQYKATGSQPLCGSHNIFEIGTKKQQHTSQSPPALTKQSPPTSSENKNSAPSISKELRSDMQGCINDEVSNVRARSRMKKRRITGIKDSNHPTRRAKQTICESRSSSLSPSKQDKAKCKRTEIDILIQSMSKEMKDGGIEDLLNNSEHVKRQRISSKRAVISSNQADNNITTGSDTSPVEKRLEHDTSTNAEITEVSSKKTTLGELTQKSPKRSQLQGKIKKSNLPKESKNEVSDKEQVISIETEKALIDEIEIRNMNTSLLEPLKYVTQKDLQQNTKTKACLFKTPKAPEKFVSSHLASTKKMQDVEDGLRLSGDKLKISESNKISNLKICSKGTPPIRCRKLSVRINKNVVSKYWKQFKKSDAFNNALLKETNGSSIRNFRKAPKLFGTSSADPSNFPVAQKNNSKDLQTVVSSAKLVANITNATENNSLENSRGNINSSKHVITAIDNSSGQGGKDPTPSKVRETINTILPQTTIVGATQGSNTLSDPFTDIVAEAGTAVEFKNEFLDENPSNIDDTILPDTPTLMARAHSVTQAAASALSSNTSMPTDIRLLTDPMSTNTYVPSFGVSPTLVDAKGTRMYTFLHPAKYNRNHGNVLLDYCCPNLDGPMPAIDPTRIHAQIQTPVIELPAFIVLTTKVVTRAELESNSSTIPAIIRKKADKLRSTIAIHQNVSSSPGTKINVTSSLSQPLQTRPTTTQPQQHLQHPPVPPIIMRPPHLSPAPHFSPALNALTKYLPSTTTITAKIRPSLPQSPLSLCLPHIIPSKTSEVSVVPKGSNLLNEMQVNLLRSNLRRFDVILKKLVQPYDKLNFTERHQIIDNLVASGKFLPKDLDRTIVLMEEYLKQINSMHSTQMVSLNSYNIPPVTTTTTPLASIQMPPLQPAPNISSTSSAYTTISHQPLEQHSSAVRKVQSNKQHTPTANVATIKQRQVPIYDTERNIIGYQLQVITPSPSTSKSVMSSKTPSLGIMPSMDGPNQRKAAKRSAQDSPRVFYTSQPLQASTPKANLNSIKYSVTPLLPEKNTPAKSQKGSIVTQYSAGPTSAETITTTTVKRVTRSRAAGSKIIIVSKSNSNEESILPDVSHQSTEIKDEKDIEDFVG